MIVPFASQAAFEAWVLEHGWPVDRPWVKPCHHKACVCPQCVPLIVHADPVFGAVRGEYRYPCGREVATDNDKQDRDLMGGSNHRRAYARQRVNCPGCLSAVQTFASVA